VERASGMDWARFKGCDTLGLTAGASAPETLVEEFVEACRERYDVTIEEISVREENVHFNLPRALLA
jgi:4-hydroxy-3-methylbut-2-enyl diphosphate reductase